MCGFALLACLLYALRGVASLRLLAPPRGCSPQRVPASPSAADAQRWLAVSPVPEGQRAGAGGGPWPPRRRKASTSMRGLVHRPSQPGQRSQAMHRKGRLCWPTRTVWEEGPAVRGPG